MTKVCFAIPSLDVGGTERQLLHLIRGLTDDHEITVLCTQHDGTLAGEARRAGAELRSLQLRGGWDPRATYRFRRALQRIRPDVLHTFLFGFDYPANRAAQRLGVPAILSSRRQLSAWKKARHIRLQQRANQLADAIVANSRAVADFAQEQEGAPERMIRVIPNGIDVTEFECSCDHAVLRKRYRIPAHTRVVGTVANLSSVKDYPLFFRVAEDLMERRPDVQFLVVGSGPLEHWFDEHVRGLDWSDRVTRVSTVTDVPDLLAFMDVFVFCSKSEGFPNAVMEAMAAGRAVVAANVGGIPELIEEGITGHLISKRDASSFGTRVDALLNDDANRNALGQRAAEKVRETFSITSMVDAYRALYIELLAQDLRRAG